MQETFCIKCNESIASEADLYVSGVLQKCIDSLIIKCDLGEFQKFRKTQKSIMEK